MKKLLCRIVVVVLCVLMLQSTIAFAALNTNYTLTGDQAKDVVTVAKAQLGKSKADFGWSVDWCAYFVCWAERTAGAFSMPTMGYPSDIAKWFVDNNKGKFYYFRDANYNSLINEGITNKSLCIKSSRSSFVPQQGDLICYLWTEDVGSYNWSHIGIVDSYNASTGVIKTVEGNTTSSYVVATRSRSYDSTVVGFVRPNYKASNPLGVIFDSTSVSMNPGQQISVPFAMKGDGIYTLDVISENENVCQVTGYDYINWSNATASVSIKGISPGSTNITVRLKDDNYNVIYSKKLPVTVNAYTGKIVASTESLTLDLQSAPSKSVTIGFNGGSLPTGFGYYSWSYDDAIISVKNAGNGEFVVTGLKEGTTTLCFDVVDATGNNCYLDGRATISVKVTAPSYTVRYNANGGSGAPGTQTKSYGTTLTLSSTKPTRSGYTFKGWSTTSSGSVQYQPGGQYTANQSVTLYAVWEVTEYTGKLVVSKSKLTLDMVNNPTATVTVKFNGGTFPEGFDRYTWYLSSVDNNAYAGIRRLAYGEFQIEAIAEGKTTIIFDVIDAAGNKYENGGATIEVTVTAPSYTVQYNANGGSGVPASQIKSYDKALTLSSTKPTRSGYTFKGWSTTSSGSVQYQPGGQYTANQSVTLYAVWEKLACSHSWGSWKYYSASQHRRTCSWCVEQELGSHNWNGGVTSGNTVTYTCNTCNGTKTGTVTSPEPPSDKGDNPVISVNSVSGRAGQIVDVTIEVQNNSGIAGMTLKLAYPKQFTLVNITKGKALSGLEYTPPGNYAANPISLNWDGLDADSGNGIILTLSFRIAEGTPDGEYSVSLSYKAGDVYDGDMEDVSPELIKGIVTVKDTVPGDANGDNIISGKDVTLIRRYLAGGYNIAGLDMQNADANEDGSINGKDVTMIRRHLAGGYGIVLG